MQNKEISMTLITVHDYTTNERILIRGDLVFKITDKLTYRLVEFTQGESEYVTETLAELQTILTQL